MRKDRASQLGAASLRLLFAFVLCAIGALLAAAGVSGTVGLLGSGGTDVNLITGTETSPRVTQNTSTAWGHGETVVVAYHDSSGGGLNPQSFCSVSTSTDGGATFTRLPERFNSGGACIGFPSVFYSVRANRWYLNALSTRCGDGIGQWESPDGINWVTSGCVASSGILELPTSWVDNNPGSPSYGRQYASFNNFSVGGGAVQSTFSTDDGVTWQAPISVTLNFQRALKITGSLGVDGTVFTQTLDEGGGGLNGPRQNFIYRSTNGGASWSAAVAQTPTFLGPGRVACSNSYFVCMYTSPAYWLDMGWGQPGVGPNNVVHYVYSARTTSPADPGNIYYVRSTDGGLTWAPPLQLNTDTTTRAQWSPSLSVNAAGQLFVSWYDERNTVIDELERFGRSSPDNGATWGNETALSDVVFPKPLQPDGSAGASVAGYFNYAASSDSGNGNLAYHTWTDGRVPINGQPQQDIFFDRIFLAPAIRIANGGSMVVSAGPNGLLDPGETVTVSLAARNTGGPGVLCTTAGLTGTLQTTGGVTNPMPSAQNYGVLCSGDPAVSRDFTFTVDPALPCGENVTISLQMTDGKTGYGTLTYILPIGTPNLRLVEILTAWLRPLCPMAGRRHSPAAEPRSPLRPPIPIRLRTLPSPRRARPSA